MNRLNHKSEVIRSLSDVTTYNRLHTIPTTSFIVDKLQNILANSNNSTNNSNQNKTALAKYVLQDENKNLSLAKFYNNMKIHKTPTLGSFIGTIIFYASTLLDKRLQPLAKNTKFYIKDSNSFIIETKKLYFPPNCLILISRKSLYPSVVIIVQLERALTCVSGYLE